MVDIVYGSLFSAVDNSGSLADLEQVGRLVARQGLTLPPAHLFAESRFADYHGWGYRRTEADVNQWRMASW